MKPGIIQARRPRARNFVPGVLTAAALSVNLLAGRTAGVGGGPNVQRGAFAALAVLVRVSLRAGDGDARRSSAAAGRQSRHPDAPGDAFQIP